MDKRMETLVEDTNFFIGRHLPVIHHVSFLE